MMKLPLVVTAASVAVLLGAHANADPTGSEMTFASSIVITGIATGTGAGSGTGSFDDSGTLTISSDTFTNIPLFMATATVTSSTVYNGSITGTTWTGDGTTSVSTLSCTGAALVCGALGALPTLNVPGVADVFSVDIDSGGVWNSITPNGPVTLTAANDLTPIPVVPPAGPGDPTAVPTMPLYGLGLTVAALFGAAARQLRTSKKRG